MKNTCQSFFSFVRCVLSALLKYLQDPFFRKDNMQNHSKVLSEIYEVKTLVSETTKKYEKVSAPLSSPEPAMSAERFPMSHMVGNQRARNKNIQKNPVTKSNGVKSQITKKDVGG